MSDLSNYPEEHPDTGKVKNPLTGNWIKKSYAKREGVLEQAKQHTQQHFKEEDSGSEDVDEIDRLLREAEEADIDDAFEIDDETLADLDDDELDRLDEHVELPDSPFPDEDEFDPNKGAEADTFQQPPTPEGLEDAARQQQGTGEYKGVYSGKNSGGRQSRPSAQQQEPQEKSLQDKHDDNDVRYVKTDAGGMKMVYRNEDNE